MKQTATTRVLLRRLALLMVVGCLVLVVGLVAWRLFLDRAGGHFDYVPADARWVLSDRARALIAGAFDDLGDAAVIVDHHVGVISQGRLGNDTIVNDSYYRRDRAGRAGPLAWIETRLRLAGAGIDGVAAVDGRYVSRLLSQIRAMPAAYQVHLLARGWRYTDAGRRDETGTYTHVANAYVWWLARQAEDVFVPVVSIHPYRPDALQRLAAWAKKGVRAVAWWPIRQNIDLRDPRARAFYTALAEQDMTLQLPVGAVDAVYATSERRVAPQVLRVPLRAGVTVVVRVHAGDRVTDRLLRLAREAIGQHLYISLSGVFTKEAAASVLMTLLQHPDLSGHLRYASGYPLSAVDARIDLGGLADQGFIRRQDVAPLREIYRVNPLLFTYVLARSVRLPDTRLRLPAAVFAGAQPSP